MAPVGLTVEFLADGRCIVSISPDSVRAGSSQGFALSGQARDPAGGGFRCPVPSAALGPRAVELRVSLPPGVDRPGDTFPRLDWRLDGHDWVATATLPSAPAFVSLRPPGTAVSGASFGWNFYGFFVFAAAFIAAYFAWARWMRGRERTAGA